MDFLLPAVALIFLLAGVVKGVVGLGLPTISMALLAIFITPAEAAALLIVPSLITNLWQIESPRAGIRLLRRLAPMQIGVCVGTWSGAAVFGAPKGEWATVALGVVLIAYAIWGLFGSPPTTRPHMERSLGAAAGLLTGLITAVTGVFVLPAVPYLQSLNLVRDDLIRSMGVSFSVSTVALALSLWLNGSYSLGAAGLSSVMLAPALLGMYIGTRARTRLSPRIFRLSFFGSLALLGAYLLF